MTGPSLSHVTVNGVALEISQQGEGRPLLFLHAGHPSGRIDPAAPVLARLAQNARVLAPTHPGFGAAAAPAHLTTVDDLAYLYLDLLDALDVRDAVLVGVSLGGWIAAEMAVKSTARLSHLVLANSVGIKSTPPDTREIADIFAMTDKELAERSYADPARMARDPRTLPESELLLIARSRESTGRYGWTPYMHDPKLKGRLHRARLPTLVLWGAADRIAEPDYGRRFAAAIPGARFAQIEGAGHFPHLEQPEAFARAIEEFLAAEPAP
jgi:pimeloyl-ACP methyl ester carboxylesterase